MNLKIYLMLLLVALLFYLPSQAQDGCYTMEKNRRHLENVQPIPFSFLGRSGTWSLTDGYGGSCTHGCAVAPYTNAPTNSGCGNYMVPIKTWIFADAGGGNQAVTTTQAADQIGYLNTYFANRGVPIEFYQVAGSPEIVENTDLNDFDDDGDATDDDDFARANHYQENVINVYIANVLRDGGCNGYAYLPTGSSGTDAIVMGAPCYSTVTDVTTNTQSAVVFIHEMGHYLGLYHTHGNYSPATSPDPFSGTLSEELVDGSNSCTTGDFIGDTPADISIAAALSTFDATSNPAGGCASRTGCTVTFTCDDANMDTYVPDLDNIMSYNNISGCRQEFSDCQKAKMVDALVCARNYLCDDDVSRHFTLAEDAALEICIGDAIPTFTAKSACYNWFTTETGGTAAATGATFTPTSGQLDVNTAGVTTFYIQDANAFNADCRQAVTITVAGTPGDGDPTTTQTIFNTQTIGISATGTSLGTDEILGWWITEGSAISATVTDQATMDAQSGTATVSPTNDGSAITTGPNVLFEADDVAGGLVLDCSGMDEGVNYYATPIISEQRDAVADATCTANSSSGGNITFNSFPGKFRIIDPADVTCRPATLYGDPTFTFTVVVSGYTGPAGELSIVIRDDNFNGTTIVNDWFNTGDGTYTYSFPGDVTGYDPADPGDPSWATGVTAIVWHQGGTGMSSGTVTFSVEVTYPGQAGIDFPTLTYTDCVFGEPVIIVCDNSLAPVELLDFTGKQEEKNVRLDWSTATEINSKHFLVERSVNGRDYETLGVVEAAGNTTEKRDYTFLDEYPRPGTNYYRLKQVDLDGAYEYFGPVQVDFRTLGLVNLFPVPVKGNQLFMEYDSPVNGQVDVQIFDAAGKLVSQNAFDVNSGMNNLSLNMEDISSGVYFLRIRQGEFISHGRVVVE